MTVTVILFKFLYKSSSLEKACQGTYSPNLQLVLWMIRSSLGSIKCDTCITIDVLFSLAFFIFFSWMRKICLVPCWIKVLWKLEKGLLQSERWKFSRDSSTLFFLWKIRVPLMSRKYILLWIILNIGRIQCLQFAMGPAVWVGMRRLRANLSDKACKSPKKRYTLCLVCSCC